MYFVNLYMIYGKASAKSRRRFFLWCLIVVGILGCNGAPDYRIQSLSLTEGEVLTADSLTVSFDVTPADWTAQHYSVHFLLDRDHLQIKQANTPAVYDGFTEGAHVLIALICDPKGVSLKTPSSITLRNFYVRQRTQPLVDLQKPLLIVHQPQQAVYRGEEGFRILFDFLTVNVQLEEGYRIHYNLNGQDFYKNHAEPIWSEAARRIGQHDLTVSLETSAGELVTGNPFNPLTKSFLVRER